MVAMYRGQEIADKRMGVVALIYILPISLALIGSREVARIPIGTVYFFDVLLLSIFTLSLLLLRKNSLSSLIRPHPGGLVLAFIVAWALFQFFSSDFSPNTFRELHPFLYMSYGVLITALHHRVGSKWPVAAEAWIFVAAGLGALVIVIQFLTLEVGVSSGLEAYNSLVLKRDSAAWILGLTAAHIYLQTILKGPTRRFWGFSIVLILQLVVALLESRAGQLASVTMLITAVLIAHTRDTGTQKSTPKARTTRRFLALVLALGLITGLSPIGSKWMSSMETGVESSAASRLSPLVPVLFVTAFRDNSPWPAVNHQRAVLAPVPWDSVESAAPSQHPDFVEFDGTVRARITAWGQLIKYMSSDPNRLLFGVGMGSDYWAKSGVGIALLGPNGDDPDPYNWPHNFVLSTLTILGLPACLAFLWVTAVAARRLWRFSRRGQLEAFSLLLLVGLVLVSSFGVVFENPWGAIAFAWALGIGLSGHQGELDTNVSALFTR